MLSDPKPKEKKMAFTIENLAKSSRDTTEDNSDGPKVSPYRMPTQTLNYSCLLEYPNVFVPNVIHSGHFDQAAISPISTPSASPSPPVLPNVSSSVLKLPLSSDKVKSKRKREDSCDSGLESPSPDRSRHTSEASFSSASSLTSDSEELDDSCHKRKKARTAFSSDQVCELEARYQKQKYLPANERSNLAQKLGLSDQQVKTWFQNRRMKEKRQQRDDDHARGYCLPTGGVDVSQLAAFGIACPPPYNVVGTSVHKLPGMSSPCLPPNQIPSHHGQFPGMLPYSTPYPGSPMFHSAYPVVSTFQSPLMTSPHVSSPHMSSRVSPRMSSNAVRSDS